MSSSRKPEGRVEIWVPQPNAVGAPGARRDWVFLKGGFHSNETATRWAKGAKLGRPRKDWKLKTASFDEDREYDAELRRRVLKNFAEGEHGKRLVSEMEGHILKGRD